jgi:hypothetical protein
MKKMLFAAALSAGFVTSANAASVIYSTNFNTPTYSDGGLIGQDSWAITGTSVVSPIAVANTATNGNVALTTTGQDVNRPFTAIPASPGSVYLQADITVSAAQATGDYAIHLGDGGASNFNARTYFKSSGAGYVMAFATSSGAAVNYGTTVLSFGTTYKMLARYDIVAGAGNDTGALYIDPTTADGSGDTAYVAATTIGTDAATISSLNLRQGTAGNAPTLVVDNMSVLAAVPEPTTLAAIAGASILGLRRRRA